MNNWYKKKDYVCPVCNKDFKKESQLKRHMMDSHNLRMKEYLETYNDVNKVESNG